MRFHILIFLDSPSRRSCMASQQPKKARITSSSVHEEFTRFEYDDEKSGKKKQGSICKKCKYQFRHTVASALKNHLHAKHLEEFNKVTGAESSLVYL